jgi:hypothetical protein
MGTTVTNNNHHSGDGTGLVVLGIVAVVTLGGIIAFITAVLTFLIGGLIIGGTMYFFYKCYELNVWKTVALASIQAGMLPPPRQAERQLPTVRELMVGRNR